MPRSNRVWNSISYAVVLTISLLGVVPAVHAQGDSPLPVWPPTTQPCIYGKAGWYQVDDIIQFIGDSEESFPAEPSCGSCWDQWSSCTRDYGLLWRKVTAFDEDNCTYSVAPYCDVCVVPCCFFFGGEQSSCNGSCGGLCTTYDACMTFWRVVSFTPDGATGRGCYKLAFYSDCLGNADCTHKDDCFVLRRWSM